MKPQYDVVIVGAGAAGLPEDPCAVAGRFAGPRGMGREGVALEELAPALLVGAVIVLVSVLGVRLAGRLGVPGLLLYLVLGLLLMLPLRRLCRWAVPEAYSR